MQKLNANFHTSHCVLWVEFQSDHKQSNEAFTSCLCTDSSLLSSALAAERHVLQLPFAMAEVIGWHERPAGAPAAAAVGISLHQLASHMLHPAELHHPHCTFQLEALALLLLQNVWRSLLHVLVDCCIVAGLAYLAHTYATW